MFILAREVKQRSVNFYENTVPVQPLSFISCDVISRVCVGNPNAWFSPINELGISVESLDLKLFLSPKPVFESMKELNSALEIIEHSVSCVCRLNSFLVTVQTAEVQVFAKRSCPYSFSHTCRSIKYQAPRPSLHSLATLQICVEAWEVAVGRRGFSPERSPPPPAGTAYRSSVQLSHR